ncbi:MAG TPA: IS21-like element helper ATPase IstB [Candidatus Binatia bacterium]|nr:IS21-like element helper ATPase IstB [Candidatus Binatia bacterium]
MNRAESLTEAAIDQHCRLLRLPTIAAQCQRLAKDAVQQQQPYLTYLAELLSAEVDERERHTIERRIKEARLPRIKALEDFDFSAAPLVSAPQIRELAEGGYINRAEPIIFIGDSGTGKTHLATGLCFAACRQKKRVRFITAAGLVNELVEAQHHNQLGRALQRWTRYDLIAIDEMGYVPFAQVGAELMFQVISERAERATLVITTNLPFSEWTQVFPNARLCKALLDRITDRATIIETGSDSYRFKRTIASKKKAR